MAHATQAPCPGCKRLLRFPAGRPDQTFRCKNCGTVIRLKGSRLSAPAARQPTMPDPIAPVVRPPSYGGRSRRLRWVVCLTVFLSAAVLAGFYLKATNSPLPGTAPALVPAVHPRPTAARPLDVVFPRRILAIAVNHYLYANPVSDGAPDRTIHALVQRMARVLRVPASQTIELSDTNPPEEFNKEDRGKPAAKARRKHTNPKHQRDASAAGRSGVQGNAPWETGRGADGRSIPGNMPCAGPHFRTLYRPHRRNRRGGVLGTPRRRAHRQGKPSSIELALRAVGKVQGPAEGADPGHVPPGSEPRIAAPGERAHDRLARSPFAEATRRCAGLVRLHIRAVFL